MKYLKLEALAWAAEEAQGNLVSTVGGDLVKISGQAPPGAICRPR